MNTRSGIYDIVNITNGHRYVGSAANMAQRWGKHRRQLMADRHHSPYLQRAWNKYGEDAFRFEVLEEWEPEFLVGIEQWWINMLQPEYNICPAARSSLGYHHTEVVRQKMSASRKGVVRGPYSAETGRNISAAKTGKKMSSVARANISAGHMGLIPWNKGKKGPTSWNKGIRTPDATRAKISVALHGHSNAAVANCARWHRDRQRTNGLCAECSKK